MIDCSKCKFIQDWVVCIWFVFFCVRKVSQEGEIWCNLWLDHMETVFSLTRVGNNILMLVSKFICLLSINVLQFMWFGLQEVREALCDNWNCLKLSTR